MGARFEIQLTNRADACEEVGLSFRQMERLPTELVGVHNTRRKVKGQWVIWDWYQGTMQHCRADAVQPAATMSGHAIHD